MVVQRKQQQRKHTRVYLWRHPEVRGYTDGRVYGDMDVSLTPKGHRQIKLVADRMAEVHLAGLYCSDLSRSLMTAEAVGRAQRPRLRPIPMPELRELALGIWEGMTFKEIMDKYPNELKQRYEDLENFKITDGESLAEMTARVVPAFQEIVSKHRGKEVCIVSHSGVNRILLTQLMGAPLNRIFRIDQDFACVNVVDIFGDGTPLIRRINDLMEIPPWEE